MISELMLLNFENKVLLLRVSRILSVLSTSHSVGLDCLLDFFKEAIFESERATFFFGSVFIYKKNQPR